MACLFIFLTDRHGSRIFKAIMANGGDMIYLTHRSTYHLICEISYLAR